MLQLVERVKMQSFYYKNQSSDTVEDIFSTVTYGGDIYSINFREYLDNLIKENTTNVIYNTEVKGETVVHILPRIRADWRTRNEIYRLIRILNELNYVESISGAMFIGKSK